MTKNITKCEKCNKEIDIRCILWNDENISDEEKEKAIKQIIKYIHKCSKK